MQPTGDDHSDVPLVDTRCAQFFKHDGDGVDADPHPVIENQGDFAGTIYLIGQGPAPNGFLIASRIACGTFVSAGEILLSAVFSTMIASSGTSISQGDSTP
jgi:hypothetical protein